MGTSHVCEYIIIVVHNPSLTFVGIDTILVIVIRASNPNISLSY